jgi:TonB-dependent Receptor Plug Domain/CarboxypepD_reg-like domain
MLKLIISFSLLFITVCCLAQNKLTGKIVDSNTKEPIEYVVISVAPGKCELTDKLGNFELMIPADSAVITVSSIGYLPQKIMITDLKKRMTIELKHGPVDLREVLITSHSNNISFHTTGSLDLNLRPVNSAQDLLRLVPGLFIAQHMGGGKAEQIFLRGFDADHGTDVNISVDGMPVNMVSHAHGQGYADMHFIIPETVTQYDFGKGPYYTGYGDFTTAGYVSYTTADVLDKSLVKIEGGQFNDARIVAAINLLSDKAKLNRQSAYVAGDATYFDGPFDFAEHFSRLNLFGKYNTRIGDNNKLSVSLSTFSTDWRASGEIPERAVASGTTGFDTSGNKLTLNAPPVIGRFGTIDSLQGGYSSRTNALIKLTSSLPNNFIAENELYYTAYNFHLHVNSTFFAEDSVNGDAVRQRETRNMFGYNGKVTNRKCWSNNTLTSVAGLGARIDRTNNSELSNTINQNTVIQYDQLGNISEDNINAYLDETLEKGKWLLNVGSRLDYFYFNYADKLNPQLPSRSNVIASPKLNIQYTVNSTLQLYLKSGKGFHSNDTRAVIFNDGLKTMPAAYGADLGFIWKPLPRLLINPAVWYLYLEQEFVYSDDGTVEPGDKTRRVGIDLSARYQLTDWLFADANVNLANPRDAELPNGQNHLALAPTFTSTGGVDFKLKDGFNGAISYRYLHKRAGNADYSLTADGYFVSDLTLNYTQKKYELGIAIENLFNTKWNEFEAEEVTRMKGESQPVDQMSFTPGTPFFAKLKLAVFF